MMHSRKGEFDNISSDIFPRKKKEGKGKERKKETKREKAWKLDLIEIWFGEIFLIYMLIVDFSKKKKIAIKMYWGNKKLYILR